jgi:hypothetical protein
VARRAPGGAVWQSRAADQLRAHGRAFQQFGVPIYAEPENGTPGGEAMVYQFVPAVQASNYNMFFHSDAETPATVPAPGLAATTRAYAKIVDEVNRMELKELQR